jgi:Na+/H+ antiporter NhaC
MNILTSLFSLALFIGIYVGSSLYYTLSNVPNAFYQLSPLVAIIPALIAAWIMHPRPTQKRIDNFLAGAAHKDIAAMCIIFLLSGAFSAVTKSIGSVDTAVNIILLSLQQDFLLIGLFIASAFISMAIGTSMGTIATVGPLAAGLAQHGACSSALGMATVVGGAMFGDNLSLISDTTIAAVTSQSADFIKKFKINSIISLVAACLTLIPLYHCQVHSSFSLPTSNYNLLLVTPYVLLITLALCRVNVFSTLTISLLFALTIGMITSPYTLLHFNRDILTGFQSMYEIVILSILIGGLIGLNQHHFSSLAIQLSHSVSLYGDSRLAQLCVAAIVSLFDILLANNTIAIIISGNIAKEIGTHFKIPPHYTAVWLDLFSCVFQGIIPHGAQVLLASSIGIISPLSIIRNVYYCYIVGCVAIFYILFFYTVKDTNE